MLAADSKLELLERLPEIDISVPPRSEGRTKEHTERCAIAYLLSTLAGTDWIDFPLKLTKRERPDFLLSTASSAIGIEHTEAVPENGAHADALREKGCGPEVYFLARHEPGESSKKAKVLIGEIEANKAGEGWAGSEAEQDWAKAMFFFAEDKLKTLRKQGFQRFDRDWLLIYDNWSLPALKRGKAMQLMMEHVNNSEILQAFDCIWVLTGPNLCSVSRRGMCLYAINDLWASGKPERRQGRNLSYAIERR